MVRSLSAARWPNYPAHSGRPSRRPPPEFWPSGPRGGQAQPLARKSAADLSPPVVRNAIDEKLQREAVRPVKPRTTLGRKVLAGRNIRRRAGGRFPWTKER